MDDREPEHHLLNPPRLPVLDGLRKTTEALDRQRCRHCYNDSAPGAAGLSIDQIDRCIASLLRPCEVSLDRIILSGCEVLVWPELLFHALKKLNQRYGDETKSVVRRILLEARARLAGFRQR